MGDTKWTKEQQLAIDTRDCNLLVAAAAGSGKTAVLVERIIKIVTDEKKPVDIDRLLVVTFTNAAAGEMRERIADAITKVLDKNPQSKQLQRQLTLLNKSNIMTIHSFCLQVIKNNFHKIDLDPNFRIADNTEVILLKSETIQDLFEDKYAERDEDGNLNKEFLTLVESYGGSRDDSALQEIVLNLYSFVMSGPWPKKWLMEMADEFNVEEGFDFGRSKWGKVLKDNLKIELHGLKDMVSIARDLAMNSNGLEVYAENLSNDEAIVDDLLASLNESWSQIHETFSNFSFSRLKTIGKKVEYDKSIQEKIKRLRDDVKDKLNSLKEEIFISNPDEINEYLRELYPRMKCLSELVIEFDKNYKAKKRERGILDFNDLEHLTLSILTKADDNGEIKPSETALNLRKDFEEILIDEYQDSNNIQEVILGMVSRKDMEVPNLFMVGDVKQSIYRFRQANPRLFLEKYLSYGTDEGDKKRKITLFKNFRSRKEVIEGVNYIFRLTMSKNVGELDYTDEESLYLGANFKEIEDINSVVGGPIELHLIQKASNKTENGEDNDEEESKAVTEEENIDNIQLEARMISKRIRDLMSTSPKGKKFKVFDKNMGDYREVQYRDIVILLRATANYAPVFAEELGNQGIPVYSDSDAGYFETIEIKTMMSLLQIIDNPMQDIPLLAVLRSPICSFTPEELIDIRNVERGVPIFEALRKTPDSETANSTISKVKGFLRSLEEWRKKSLHMPIDELIWYLYSSTGYYGYAGAMQGGDQRQANLRILFERARQFEKTSYRGLFNFVNFIKKLQTSSGDMGSAKILGENEDVVRIMSIHKSKGLEFPVVIMAGAGKNFNLRDMNRSILFHHELGYGPNYVDPDRRISYQTILKQALKRKIKLESLSEEMRVLYVAFTRAKEKLIITGSVNDLEAASAKWCSSFDEGNKIPEYSLIKGKSYLDWIIPCIAKHEDGEKIRELAHVSDEKGVIWDDSAWAVYMWRKEDIIVNENYDLVDKLEEFNKELESSLEETDRSEERLSELKEGVPESAYKDEIYRRLSWKYPFNDASEIPAKLSVTELKRLGNSKFSDDYSSNMYTPSLIKKPLFLEEVKELTAAEKGTVLHSVMQHIDLNKTTSKDIKEKISEMVVKEMLTEKQAEAVNKDIRKIERFFESDIGRRVIEANNKGRLFREFPFYMRLNSTEVFEKLSKEKYEEEIILLQGVIDCFFEDEDGVVLLDYKTDFYSNPTDIMRKYEKQIHYYTEALKKITGKNVKERYLYLFSKGEVIEYK